MEAAGRLKASLAKDLGGYRIVSRESCPGTADAAPSREDTEAALAQLPECPEGR